MELAGPTALVFGGCCSNVFFLESVLKDAPQIGPFLTAVHFIFIAAQSLHTQITFKKTQKTRAIDGEVVVREVSTWLPRLKARQVPMRRWAGQIAMFAAVSFLNNWAFGFHVPVALHIIFRSGGLAFSMAAKYLIQGRRYSRLQVLSVLLVSAGIIVSTFSSPPRNTKPSASATSSAAPTFDLHYMAGIAILTLALAISAVLGLYQETTFAQYSSGDVWKEGLFYSHFLSLPLFLPLIPSLPSTLSTLNNGPPLQLDLTPFIPSQLISGPTSPLPIPFFEPRWLLDRFGIGLVLVKPQLSAVWVALAANVLSQAVCVSGVNRLVAKTSSLNTSLILTLRKAASLFLSVWWFSGLDQVGPGLILGGTLVLGGTALYSLAGSSKQEKKQ